MAEENNTGSILQGTKPVETLTENNPVGDFLTENLTTPAPTPQPEFGSILQGTKDPQEIITPTVQGEVPEEPQSELEQMLTQKVAESELEGMVDGIPGLEGEVPEGTNTVLAAPENLVEIERQEQEQEALRNAELQRIAEEQEAQARERMAAKEMEMQQREAAAKQRRAMEVQQKAEADVERDVEQVKKEESHEGGLLGGTLGERFRKGIALMIGGVSQGLLGTKTNPAMDYLEKEAERVLEARQMDEKKRNDARLALMDMAKYRMQVAMNRTKNAKMRAEMQKIYTDMDNTRNEVAATQQMEKLLINNVVDEDTMNYIKVKDPKRGEFAVKIPGSDKWTFINNKTKVKDVQDMNTEMAAAERDLGQLIRMTDDMGNNAFKKIASFSDRAAANALQRSVIGAMRIVLFGPGVMTDTEQNLAKDIINNPTKVFSIASSSKASLGVLLRKVRFAAREGVRQAGGKVPLNRAEKFNEKMVNMVLRGRVINPKTKKRVNSKASAVTYLMDTNRWKDEYGDE